MSATIQSSINLTRRAIVAYQAGRPEAARELLGDALQLDPANELAWIWLAALAHKPEEKRYCLERACELNPEGAARDALVELAGVDSVAAGVRRRRRGAAAAQGDHQGTGQTARTQQAVAALAGGRGAARARPGCGRRPPGHGPRHALPGPRRPDHGTQRSGRRGDAPQRRSWPSTP